MKNNPFTVPENYFSEFSDRMKEKTALKEKGKAGKSLIGVLRPALMLAAAMLVFAIISYTAIKYLIPEQAENNYEVYTDIAYEYDEYELMDKIIEDYDNEGDNTDQDIIIEYLIDNGIEYTTIIEHIN